MINLVHALKGDVGRGNWAHGGLPGQVGGSSPGGGARGLAINPREVVEDHPDESDVHETVSQDDFEQQQAREFIQRREAELLDKTLMTGREHGTLVDREGNDITGIISGDESSVKFKINDLMNARGGTLTHTHPAGVKPGLSFNDVRIATLYGIGEVRAVGADFAVYSFKPPTEGIWTNEKISESWELAEALAGEELQKRYGSYADTPLSAFNEEFPIIQNEKFAEITGGEFTMEAL